METSMFNIDFGTDELQFPCHARHQDAAARIKNELSAYGLKNHFLVFSSGTTSTDLKGYALSKDALFTNARAVNEHFGLTSNDVWGLSIPYFHVGGLSVLTRAHVLKSGFVDLGGWGPLEWSRKLSTVTVTTVVPTQVFDLVQLKLRAPAHLKFLIVGGDYLGLELEKRAIDLGWPVIRTFGMTEVCSQLASGRKPGEKMEVLPIHEVKTREGRLLVKSMSLFTMQFKLKGKMEIIYASDLCDEDGFYKTNDLAEIEGPTITPLGRSDDQIKVSGKLVSMNILKERLYTYCLYHDLYGKAELVIETDERMGKRLVLLHLQGAVIPADILAPLKPEFRQVSGLERTDLGKLKK